MTATAAKTKAPELKMSRDFAHPPEAVYRAWIEQDALRQWMGPEGMKTPDATIEPRVGGKFAWPMIDEEGKKHLARGEIVEMVPNERLRFAWFWDQETGGSGQVMEMTLEFKETDKGTRMTLHQTNFISEKARDDHEGGWSSTFNELETWLAKP